MQSRPSPQPPAKARPGAERPARYVEVGGSGGYGRMGLRPDRPGGAEIPGGRGAVAVAVRVYILRLRQSNPPKPGKRRLRASAGGSR